MMEDLLVKPERQRGMEEEPSCKVQVCECCTTMIVNEYREH